MRERERERESDTEKREIEKANVSPVQWLKWEFE
jgi:hypothetical protein